MNNERNKMKLQYDKEMCQIKCGDKIVTTWNDEASHDYPEDLTWSRDIGSLVQNSVDFGYELGRQAGYLEAVANLRKHEQTTTQRINTLSKEVEGWSNWLESLYEAK